MELEGGSGVEVKSDILGLSKEKKRKVMRMRAKEDW